MAHYQYVAFYRPEEEMKNTSSVNQDSLLKADGIIYGGEIFSLDTLRWMLPEMSEEKRKETFQKLLSQIIKEAEGAGFIAYLYFV